MFLELRSYLIIHNKCSIRTDGTDILIIAAISHSDNELQSDMLT